MHPLFRWNNFIMSKIYCNCPSFIILYIRTMIPLFWRNYTFITKTESNCPFFITNNSRIMIILFIWNFSIFICLFHCYRKIRYFVTHLWILILLVLPFFRYINTIVPKIVTYGVSFVIF